MSPTPPMSDAASDPDRPDGSTAPDDADASGDAAELMDAKLSAQVADYAAALEKLTAMLGAGVPLAQFLQSVCTEVAATIADADMVGITMLSDGGAHPETAASTDARVNDIDADQYRADQGPCLEAARTRRTVRVRVSDVAVRWPQFAANVADIAVQSYLSAPIRIDDHHFGAINIYSYNTHGFSGTDEALVQLFVTAVQSAISISRRAETAEHDRDGLTTAMKTRAGIEQAKGIIMTLRGITAEEAFDILSAQSQSRNIKLADIAAALVASVAPQDPATPPPS
ncbi:GAF and ANTAR domain-containing protein [Rhodococcus sp. IEGM 1343]|uniref:GAF and ANTAR domain-containing protein n=1 Tax=Rhodococcus sp. IEGM 1343 TaxID=3082224 RepID=UPI0029533256|nr:GAF and ANTAR domain-containing protein [Rhodococcus sp. IEGM 1343]MDV8056439.1 GAF and ANTAR domain-containing protein [Rhodococcus sp. IEGM 1343]